MSQQCILSEAEIELLSLIREFRNNTLLLFITSSRKKHYRSLELKNSKTNIEISYQFQGLKDKARNELKQLLFRRQELRQLIRKQITYLKRGIK